MHYKAEGGGAIASPWATGTVADLARRVIAGEFNNGDGQMLRLESYCSIV